MPKFIYVLEILGFMLSKFLPNTPNLQSVPELMKPLGTLFNNKSVRPPHPEKRSPGSELNDNH